MASKDKKNGTGGKRSWRGRFSLSTLFMGTSVLAVLAAGFVAGFYALRILYQNKLTDTWAILFLQLEHQGNEISRQFETFTTTPPAGTVQGAAREISSRSQPDVILQVGDQGRLTKVQGDFPSEVTLKDLHLDRAELADTWNILQLSGKEYLAVNTTAQAISKSLGAVFPPGNYFLLWKVDIESWLGDLLHSPLRHLFYLVTKEGRLVYSNDPHITQITFENRPLVQRFISAPFQQGQLEFEGALGPSYGFYYQIPRTNVLMFSETARRVVLSTVYTTAVRFLMALGAILGLVTLLLHYPLSSLTMPIQELARLAKQVGDGNFDVRPRNRGFGELNQLTQSFQEMGKSLVAREEKINALLIEQREKVRLAGELAIAQSIQDNFLLKTQLPPDSGVDVAAQYSPASEVAGDWYGYYYDDATDEAVFAIADVSGHGAGSAMFTAIIAATFEEVRVRAKGSFPMDDFARRLNRLILKLGRGKWHCTLCVAKFRLGTHQMEILNCGHPFPVMIFPAELKKKSELIVLRSDLLGISLDLHPASTTLDFPKGSSLLMYTDGLIEGRPDRKVYSQRRLIKVCQGAGPQPVGQMVGQIYEDWARHLEGQTPLDDLCLLAVRAAA